MIAQARNTLYSMLYNKSLTNHTIALSVAVGIFFAFSPFIGLKTLMIFATYRPLGLNLPILCLSSSADNLFTMFFINNTSYCVGYCLLHHILNFDPGWNIQLEKIWGSGNICVWSFIIGGIVLGLIIALASYYIARYSISHWRKVHHSDGSYYSNLEHS